MECKVTCFDRVMHLVKELPEDKKEEMCELITDYGLLDVLDFGVQNNCFTKNQSQTLYEGIVMWEDLDSNYYEEDEDRLNALYEKMGITTEMVRDFQEKQESLS